MPAPALAVVGRACLLPGATTPERLWEAVAGKEDLLGPVPEGRWRVDRKDVLCGPEGAPDRTWTDRGGYVTGFDQLFDPTGFGISADEIDELDPLYRWLLHTARAALRDAGAEGTPRTGAIFGNLSYPTASLVKHAEAAWADAAFGPAATANLGLLAPNGSGRFVAGLPAAVLGRSLELQAAVFALDAACASSLYAIKLAGDQLTDGSADVMLAGAVCCADNLLIHQGFAALEALSRSGQSRPFHRDADGLIPAEGCAFIVLKRLEDAIRAGDTIRGVVRGVGLSNDGRDQGVLVPSPRGQERAIRSAYQQAGTSPDEVSLVECHATGTPVGDKVELESMAAVFGRGRDLPIGSLKGNIGHPITVAGAAALIKVLAAIEHNTLPPTAHCEAPLAEIEGHGFRVLDNPEDWPGPRKAAVSAFGFGGNNAHLIVEAYEPANASVYFDPGTFPKEPVEEVAIVGVGAMNGDLTGVAKFSETLFAGRRARPNAESVELQLENLGVSPKDLGSATGQQTIALATAIEAAGDLEGLTPGSSTGVFIGIETDPDAARYGIRWRLARWARRLGLDEDWIERARESISHPFDSASVLGAMPNMPANRINRRFDAEGPGFTVSAGEQSGLVALDIATRALRCGEITTAVVGAVDLACHPIHERAADEVLPPGREQPGDAAAVLILKPRSDAEAAGDRIYALINGSPTDAAGGLTFEAGSGGEDDWRSGHAYAAAGLIDLTAAALCIHHRATPGGQPWLSGETRRATVHADNSGFAARRWSLREARSSLRDFDRPAPVLQRFAGGDRQEVLARLEAGEPGGEGPAQLVIAATGEQELRERCTRARRHLCAEAPGGHGVHFFEQPIGGEVAFVHAAAGAAYPQMGLDLLRNLPELSQPLATAAPALPDVMDWVYSGANPEPCANDFLWASSALAQIHTEFTRGLLRIEPDAMIGHSSGETSSLFAGGAWTDYQTLYEEILESGLMDEEIGGRFRVLERLWGSPSDWRMWNVRAPVERVLDALLGRERVHMAIINSPSDCVIAGERSAVAQLAGEFGSERTLELPYRVVCHVPEVEAVAELWHRLHKRPVSPTPGIRYYTNATSAAYVPGEQESADALLAQAVGTIDFRATIEAAYADGIRVFVEHGPQNGCTGWIGEVLQDRPHLAVSLDRRGHSFDAALNAAAALMAAGVPFDTEALTDRLRPASSSDTDGPTLTLPARWPPFVPLPRPVESADRTLHESATDAGEPRLEPVDMAPTPHRSPLTSQRDPLGALVSNHFQAHDTTQSKTVDIAATRTPGGPRCFDRADLEVLASGRISDVFGPEFAGQDAFRRQVRMPAPPLLLADRVTQLNAEPSSMERGTIITETDVSPSSWYLHDGYMPAGLMIEAGQADLLLISYLGVDAINQGERVYRLLGCTLTFEGDLPHPGETLEYEISLDEHATHGDIRLFFFHYTCSVGGQQRLRVEGGQAGFFSDTELAATQGVPWSAENAEPSPEPNLDPPLVEAPGAAFSHEQVTAFAAGRPWQCFGADFDRTRSHVRPPRIASGDLQILDEVTELDPAGGPWGRGYLRATTRIAPDEWFFAGHFKDDPCMPGTLMFEATIQAMAIYLAACGHTLDHDGWRFQPVTGEPFELKCRGQVTPASKEIVWEIFVDELEASPKPTLYADVLATVDGVRAFHGKRIGLQLVPDWPLTSRPELASARAEPEPVASAPGIEFGHRAMIAAAWGRPSDAFGAAYERFDGTRQVARLPGPPFHFISRVTAIEGELGRCEPGAGLECAYDIPPDAWFFTENGAPTMPLAVLLEAALQPCGWLACFVGCPLSVEQDLAFRNLDGTATLHREIRPGDGPLLTTVRLTDLSLTSSMILTSFAVTCRVADSVVLETNTTFGFFPPAALSGQAGLPTSPSQREQFSRPQNVVADVRSMPPGRGPALARRRLLMLDRVTGHWDRSGGKPATARAEKDVDAADWYFRSHFFGDPVQPGSLGIEALIQLLQWQMIDSGLAEGRTRFEPLAVGVPLTWKYRGQAVPSNKLVTTTVEVTESSAGDRESIGVCDGSLWVDGMRVYEITNLAMRAIN